MITTEDTCTIRRTFTFRRHAFREVTAMSCGNPLRTPHQQNTGVCDVCSTGYESTTSRFANDEEYHRAVAAKESS